jgi:hypothetical protein
MTAEVTRLQVRLRQVAFDRSELSAIMQLYGRMVAAGLWKDYAIANGPDAAVFSGFRRASERPEYQVVKRPDLRSRQGMYALVSEGGAVLKRAHELTSVLAPVERKMLKLLDA